MMRDFKFNAYFLRTFTYNQITLIFLLYISATLDNYEMLQEVYTYKVSQCLLQCLSKLENFHKQIELD